MADSKLIFQRSLWTNCLGELRRRGDNSHESGCFVIGSIYRNTRRATQCVYYDELDSAAYAKGICELNGESFTRLWTICREAKMTVVADIHTHYGAGYQSESDRMNPMIARRGHIAIIIPGFAKGLIWRHKLGLYHYEGNHIWTNFSGWQARTLLKLGWSLL